MISKLNLIRRLIESFKPNSSNIQFEKDIQISHLRYKQITSNLINKIYICHHKPLVHRKRYLESRLFSKGLECEWVEDFLPQDIENQYDQIVGTKELKLDLKMPGISQGQYKLFKNAGTKITITELSLYKKIEYCLKDQVKGEKELILILEDDIVIPNNITEYLDLCASEFVFSNINLDCLMVGTAFGFKSQYYKPDRLIHYGKDQLTRCTHAMMFSFEGAKKILRNLYPINWPIDFKLNEIFIKERMRVAWAEPGLVQLSHTPYEESSLSKVRE
tara:strand:- start:4586 stop:5410 length:825 start_codon:yes stop_codon:yes gene_type:complete